jgi:hypothetical protein
MRRRRVRTWAKWGATLATVLAVGAAVASRFWTVAYMRFSADGVTSRHLFLGEGLVEIFELGDWPTIQIVRNEGWFVTTATRWRWVAAQGPGRHPGAAHGGAGVIWWKSSTDLGVELSLLNPVVLTTIPAAFLWYKDRRRFGPHACKGCGYDRRGLRAEARCPECGAGAA